MKYRLAAQLGMRVSEIGLGCWQLGGSQWGDVSQAAAFDILQAAVNHGVTFLDTADVYGAGRSETLIGDFLAGQPGGGTNIFVATKLGRLHGYPDQYSLDLFRRCVTDSLARLKRPTLDLVQLHCVPPEYLRSGEAFDWLAKLKAEGLIRHAGASVETMEEAMLCLGHDTCASLQIIFNIFRQKPLEQVLVEARKKGVAIIVRLPLASGLLAGKMTPQSSFAATDHRTFNRNGEQFNVGETFAGLPFEKGLELTSQLKTITGESENLARVALRWILDFPAVTTVIPGATRPAQVTGNVAASDAAPLSPALHEKIRTFYETQVKAHIRGPY